MAKTAITPITQSEPPTFQKEDEMNNTSNYALITALYERLSIGDERHRKEGEDSNLIQNQKLQLEQNAKANGFVNIK